MSWRTVVITGHAKLSYKNNYMIVRGDEIHMIHLSEINTILIDSTAVSITSYLLSEAMKRKIKIVFCDEQRNPQGEVVPYYGCHNTSKKIVQQIQWNEQLKKEIWTQIIRQKILNQAYTLHYYKKEEGTMLMRYADELTLFDETNREGHAAKVYFNALFGKKFNRDDENSINGALDYGYSILLSNFNKEIVGNGYLTQLGLKHSNQFNCFNLSSDLMEPFRPLVDRVVYENRSKAFNIDYKLKLVGILNEKVGLNMKEYYLTNAIQIYLKSIFDALEKNDINELQLYEMI